MQTITRETELTSDCQCEVWDEDGNQYALADTCAGFCFEDALEGAVELITEWLESKKLEPWEQVTIYGTRLGWRSLAGYKLAGTEPVEIAKALFLNGDFTIRFKLTPEGELTATRASHDEYGAGFEFAAVPVCYWSECDTLENLTNDTEGHPYCEWHTLTSCNWDAETN